MKEAQYLAEEKAEKKIELLTMSMKKTKKRKRFMDQDDEDEYVSSVLLHAEQVKLQVGLAVGSGQWCWCPSGETTALEYCNNNITSSNLLISIY